MKVLLCEDDIDIVELMQLLLNDLGIDSCVARNSNEVFALLNSEDIGMIVVDYWLSDGKADDMVSLLTRKYQDIPILMVSAVDNIEQVSAKLGITHVLKKPFNIQEFQERIQEIIGRS